MRHFTVKFLSKQPPLLNDLLFSAEDPVSAYDIARAKAVDIWSSCGRGIGASAP